MDDLDLLLLDIDNEEVLEVGDAFMGAVSGENEVNVDTPTVTAPPIKDKAKKPRRKRKNKAGYSTKQARHKKAELLALRTEAQDLELLIQYLTNRRSGGTKRPVYRRNYEGQEAAKAMQEFQKLQRSEETNRDLKAVLTHQTNVRKAILNILRQVTTFEGKDVVFGSPCKLTESYRNAGVLAQLKNGARNLYLNLNETVPQRPSTAYSSTIVPKTDPSRGKIFVSSTSCTVSCSMKFASDALWLEYSTPRKYENKSYRYMDPVGSDAVKKSFDLLLQSKLGQISMHGLMFAYKFQDTDRVSIVRDYIAFLPTAGLHMRCHHWTIITPGDTEQSCNIHFYFQMFTESDPNFIAATQDVEYVHEVGLEAWINKMHMYSHLLHDRLEINSVAISS